jgi:hypothetical protein
MLEHVGVARSKEEMLLLGQMFTSDVSCRLRTHVALCCRSRTCICLCYLRLPAWYADT